MKKLLLLASFFLIAEKAFAFEKDSIWKEWRSSETTTVETDVSIATGVIYLKGVVVSSGTTTDTAQLQFFNSSGTIAGGVSRSSSAIYDIDSTDAEFPINQVYSKGLRYTKTGTSGIVIDWDYYSRIEPGQERKGLK